MNTYSIWLACIQLAIGATSQNTTGYRFLYNTAVTTLDVICLLTKLLKRNFKSNKLDHKKNPKSSYSPYNVQNGFSIYTTEKWLIDDYTLPPCEN